MHLEVYRDHQALSDAASNEIIELLKTNPAAVVCMASGETPRLTCQLFVQKAKEQGIELGKLTFIGLDEWVGIPPSNEGSCSYFFRQELVAPLGLPPSQIHLFDALSENLQQQCINMDRLIADKGGINLVIVGLGMNGHIGFNEPGVSFDNYSHVAELDETTVTVGQKYFRTATVLKKGITIGLKHLKEAKKVLLLANGSKKAAVVRNTVEGEIGPHFPASIMQTLSHGYVMIDEEAASLI
jgi:galactosamine-6-phosphate isomerase